MDKKIEPKLLQGFRDLNPTQAENQLAIIRRLEKTCRLFGYQPLYTPALEYAEVLLGKYGQEGEKLVYKFRDLGEREIALRYDLTVSLARYVAANFKSILKPFKRYQYGPVWRAEKPQKGRFREFFQFDADIVGSDSYQSDAEIIALVYQILLDLGVREFKILINSRKILTSLFEKLEIPADLSNRVMQIIDKLEKIGFDSVIADLKSLGLNEKAIASLSAFLQNKDDAKSINPEEGEKLELIIKSLENYGIDKSKIVFSPTLVRGLDYYTGFVFEAKLEGAEEFGSVISGGRFDKLISLFSTEETPSVGLSVGVDRIADALSKLEIKFPSAELEVLIAFSKEAQSKALKITSGLRNNGVVAEIFFEEADLGKKLKYANGKNVPLVVILEDTELEDNIVRIKNMETGVQTNIELDEDKIISKIKELLNKD